MAKGASHTVKQIGVNCYAAERIHRDGLFVPNHWHDYFEFELVLEGTYEHVLNGKPTVAKPGDSWLVSYFDYHSIKALEESKILTISFTDNYLPSEISDLISSSVHCGNIRFDDETKEYVHHLGIKIINEFQNKDTFYKYSVSSLLREIIITAIRRSEAAASGQKKVTPKLIQSVTSYLYKNHKSDLSLTSIAEKFFVSPGHLGYLFKTTFSTSYNDYVNRIRMKYACDLLASSRLSMKEISTESGYNSVEYFYYTFKKHLGCTPAQYRKQRDGEILAETAGPF